MTIEFNGASFNNVGRARRPVIDIHSPVKPDALLVREDGIEALLPDARNCEEPSAWPTSQQPVRPLEPPAHEPANSFEDFLADESDPGAQLKHLITRQAEAVVEMRGSTSVLFGDDGFAHGVIVGSGKWSLQLEEQWASVVGACMNLGYLDKGDTLITTGLVLGMIVAAAQHSPPAQISAKQITRAVVTLLRLEIGSGRSK
jgi:hypothetical protein